MLTPAAGTKSVNTFYVRLLLAFMLANFIVLGISIFGTRLLIDSETVVEHDIDLDALQALARQTYLTDGASGVRALNRKYSARGLSLFLFENGETADSEMPRPLMDSSTRLSLGQRSTIELPRNGQQLHSLPLIGEGIPPDTALIVHQRPLSLDRVGPGRRAGGPGGPEHRPGGPGRPPGGPGGEPGSGPGSSSAGLPDESGNLLHGATRTTLLVYLGLLMVGIAVAGWVVARNLTAPLRSVQAAINQFANGDLSARVGTHLSTRGDDMGRVARDFDHMADGVEEMIRGRDRLLHHLSHEMRSPLARLRFALELARGADTQDDTYIDRADLEIDRLDKLMDEMLQLARSENDANPIAETVVSLAQLVEETAERVAMDAQAANVRIEFDTMNHDVSVSSKGELLDRAIENVVRNAIKYSPEGGAVTVSCRSEDGVAVLDVQDQGPGVPPNEHAALFEPFYRASNSAPGQGYGLGLAIVARAMRQHGGRVETQNVEPSGLRVRMTIPAVRQTNLTGH